MIHLQTDIWKHLYCRWHIFLDVVTQSIPPSMLCFPGSLYLQTWSLLKKEKNSGKHDLISLFWPAFSSQSKGSRKSSSMQMCYIASRIAHSIRWRDNYTGQSVNPLICIWCCFRWVHGCMLCIQFITEAAALNKSWTYFDSSFRTQDSVVGVLCAVVKLGNDDIQSRTWWVVTWSLWEDNNNNRQCRQFSGS